MASTVRQKIGQCMIVGLSGKALNDHEKQFLTENNVGGVVLFDRNIDSPKQLHDFITEIQSVKVSTVDKQPFFVSVDMEGGRVARLKAPFTQWPALRKLGDIDSPAMAFKFGEYMAQELQAIGFNLDFAPCVDTLTNESNKIIGDRSLSDDAEKVAKNASAIVRGYIKGGVIPCTKHFPGHGNTAIDSHEDLPVEETDLETLMNRELIPFKKTFRARLDLMMTGHLKFPKIDPEWPATLSEIFLKDILREQLKYRNLVITDDLDMKALRNNYSVEEIATRSVIAGNQILLYCNEPESPQVALDALEKAVTDKEIAIETIERNYSMILKVKKAKLRNIGPIPLQEASRIIGNPNHLTLSKSIEAGEIPEGLTT